MKNTIPNFLTLLTSICFMSLSTSGMCIEKDSKTFVKNNPFIQNIEKSHLHETNLPEDSPFSLAYPKIVSNNVPIPQINPDSKGLFPPVAKCNDLIVLLDGVGKHTLTTADIYAIGKGSYDPDGGPVTMTVTPMFFDCAAVGDNAITLTVTDSDGNKASCTSVLTVTDGTPPQGVLCQPYTAQLGVGGTATVFPADVNTAVPTDNCGIASYLISKSATGPFNSSVSYTCSDIQTAGIPVYISVIDIHGNGAYCSTLIKIRDNTPPVIICPGDKSINCYDPITTAALGSASATDNCGLPTSGAITFTDERINGKCPNSYIIKRIWKVTDNSNNSAFCTQTITVQDITIPTLSGQGSSLTINCPATPVFTAPKAADACDTAPVITFSDKTVPGTAAGTYIITRTWLATDACGNASLPVSQAITVVDKTPPVITVKASNLTVACDGQGNTKALNDWLAANGNASAKDSCSIVKWTNNFTGLTKLCGATGSATITFTASDDSKNIATTSAIFTIIDTIAPVITCLKDITVNADSLQCGANLIISQPSFVENCSSVTIVNNFNQSANASGFYKVGITSIKWTITDECGNSSTCQMKVTVLDKKAPVITCPPDILICSTEKVVLGNATATDICGIASITNNAPVTFNPGTTLVLWTATDVNGNKSTGTQKVTVIPVSAVNAGADAAICEGSSFKINSATSANTTLITWTHDGKGILSGEHSLTPTYTPALGESGIITLTLTGSQVSPCTPDAQDKMSLKINSKVLANANIDQTIRKGKTTQLNGSAAGGSGSYSWNWSPKELLVSNTIADPKTLVLNAETKFILSVQDIASGCKASDSMFVFLVSNEPPKAIDDYRILAINTPGLINLTENDSDPDGDQITVTYLSNPLHGNVSLLSNNTVRYTPNQNYVGDDTFNYIICDNGTPSLCDTAVVTITISTLREMIEVYNLITPNGDGKNDKWIIKGINEFSDNDILIFNRWGDKIRDFNSYNNTDNFWDGTNTNKEYVPDGVYYYIIKIKNMETLTGWVYVNSKGNRK